MDPADGRVEPLVEEVAGAKMVFCNNAAVGALQFDVFAHRLASEFNAPIEIRTANFQGIRLTDPPTAQRLRAVGGIRIMRRGDDALVAIFESRYRLERLEATEPELTLRAILADTGPTA